MNNNKNKGIALIAAGILSITLLPFILKSLSFYTLWEYYEFYHIKYVFALGLAGLGISELLKRENDNGNQESESVTISSKQRTEPSIYHKDDIFQSQIPQPKNKINMENRKHGFPALISFFIPGLGQIIKGHFLKGFLIWLIGGTAMFIFSLTIILIPFALIIWAWNIYDAYNSN